MFSSGLYSVSLAPLELFWAYLSSFSGSFGSVRDSFWLSCGILGARTAGQYHKTAPLLVLSASLGTLLVTSAVLRQSWSSSALSLSPKDQKWSQDRLPVSYHITRLKPIRVRGWGKVGDHKTMLSSEHIIFGLALCQCIRTGLLSNMHW